MDHGSRILALFIAGLMAYWLLALAPSAHAAAPAPGSLVKGPLDAVYYYAVNGKRYVFPTEKTYLSWYADFSGVTTVSADELAALTVGGNATYRPGVRLVKINTDPKVYAVSAHGVLRWVQTEQLAQTLYGADWNQKIDDVPETYFVNYMIGSPIANSADYSPSGETAAATDIGTDKQLVAPAPAPTPTPTTTASTFTFSVSKSTLQGGDIIALTAAASDPAGIAKIELFFDGTLIKTCTSVSCSGETQVPLSGTKSSYVAEGRVTKVNAQVESKTVTLPVSADGSSLVQIAVGQAVIMPNQAASVVADVDVSVAVIRIDIYVDGTGVKACATGARQCQWSDYVSGAVSSTHPVYAKATDSLGRTYISKTLTITISTNDTPGVTVSPAKTSIYAGETLDVTVTATDSDGVASIDVMKDGAVLKHCDGAQPCTATTGPWPTAGTILTFTGRAADAKGTVGTGDPQTVSVVAP